MKKEEMINEIVNKKQPIERITERRNLERFSKERVQVYYNACLKNE